jgi:signal transduction histidine kinase
MPILGAVDLMESKLSDEDARATRGELDIITRNTKRLQRLTEELLQISKIESGNFRLQKEKVDLCQLAADNINDVRIKYDDKSERVAIDLVCDRVVIEAECDPVRIGEVMFNLLDNAMKFTEQGAIIVHIQDMSKSGWFLVRVTDTGTGISADVENIMFEKFITTSNTGAGIGLYLCMKIIEAHGGSISGQNRKDGNGAVFTFTIPSNQEEIITKHSLDKRLSIDRL